MENTHSVPVRSSVLNAAVLIAALGYFVDIYDLILFSIVRVPSLRSLGYEGENLFSQGVVLLNCQMIGMLIGGIFWGILGDKRGRLSVLFGSILLYSIANVANGLVQDVHSYALWRLIAGIGLAGELGAGITLVAEVLPKEKRGYGTTIVASVGICGALLAANVAEHLDWRRAYFVGGGLGLCLLFLRIGVLESGLFEMVKATAHRRGDFLSLFQSRSSFLKYLRCILIGVPVWYVVGILITFSPEFAKAKGGTEPVSAGKAVMYCYLGMAIGDLASGLLSQALRSRKKVVLAFLALTTLGVLYYLHAPPLESAQFYAVCCALGFGGGYWALFVTIATEQFGTDLRATVTITVPNFVRGSVVPLTFLFISLRSRFGINGSALFVGILSLSAAFLALWGLEETFSKDLNYLESRSEEAL